MKNIIEIKTKLGHFKVWEDQANLTRNLGKIGNLGREISFKKNSIKRMLDFFISSKNKELPHSCLCTNMTPLCERSCRLFQFETFCHFLNGQGICGIPISGKHSFELLLQSPAISQSTCTVWRLIDYKTYPCSVHKIICRPVRCPCKLNLLLYYNVST